MGTNPKQCLSNLPDELLRQPRFFRVGRYDGGVFNHKIPIDKWRNPANLRRYNKLNFTDERQLAGFDIVGHDNAQDYLVLDFDHVLNDEGQFVNDAAQKWYNYIALTGTYIEKSISGHGLHAIFKPNDGEFNKMASGCNARLNLGGDACIEIYYKPGGRYFLFTGDVYECEPKTPISTNCDVVHSLIDEITQPAKKNSAPNSADPYLMQCARDMLKFLPCHIRTDIDYSTWLGVGMILKSTGNPIEDWLNWSKNDSARYDEAICRYKWETFSDSQKYVRDDNYQRKDLSIKTLNYWAKQHGYKTPPLFYAHLDFDIIPDEQIIEGESEFQQFVTPTGYEVTTAGVFKLDSKGNVKKIAKSPIYITALYYRDSDDTRLVDIWTRDTNGRELVIDRVDKDVISDTKKITALSARGLSVTSNTAKLLVDYLDDYIDCNKENLIPQKLLTKIGWYADDLFVTPYGKRFNLDMERLGNFADALQQQGSFSDWKALAKEVMEYPVARFTLAACLAPPLLRILGERTFSIYLMCDSTAGKSAVAKFGGSCWGNEGVVRNLRATINGIEGELAECTDFPFIADEKQLAENMNMQKIAYLIAQGQGKGRMTKDGKPKKRRQWRTIGILSGEEIITDDIATQGAITRTLQIIVIGEKIIPKDLAKKIYSSIQTNYGYAGQCFIDNLLKENFDELRELKEYFTLQIETRGKLIDDYNRYIALISIADYLMQRYFFDVTDKEANNNALVNAYAITETIQSKKELSDATREWTLISGWIAENRGLILNNPNIEFVDDNGNIHMPAQNKIIGVYEDNSIFILVSALKDYCKRQGLNYSKVIRDLDGAGYIVRGKDRPSQCKWIEGANTRVVQFKFHEETFT